MLDGRVTVRHDGPRVQIIDRVSGRLIADITAQHARDIADALKAQAGKAEEIEQRERLVFEEALLLRTGALPLSLVHDRHLRHEAEKEAAWNSDLRRYLPGGVKATQHFGVLEVIQHQPTPAQAAKQRAYERRKGQGQ